MIVMPSGTPEDYRRLNAMIAARLADDLENFDWNILWLLDMRCPEWLVDQAPDRCERAVRDLCAWASDPFDHEITPLQEWVLYESLRDWLEAEEDYAAEEKDPERAAASRRTIEDVNLALEIAFWDWDFLLVPEWVRALQRDGALLEELGVDVGAYAELMPDDVRARVEAQLKVKAERDAKDEGSPPEPPTC